MTIMDQKSGEDKVIELTREILNLEHKGQSEESIQLKESRLNIILDLLEEEDPEFIQLWNHNMDLLASEELVFKVDQSETKSSKAYSKDLFGSMNASGKLIFKAKEEGSVLIPMAAYRYPSAFFGQIDALGRAKIEVDSRGFTPSARKMPSAYKGAISATGKVVMEVTKMSKEWLGAFAVTRISAHPFLNEADKKSDFLKTRELILEKVKNRISQIVA